MKKDFEGWPMMDDKEIAHEDKEAIVERVRALLARFPMEGLAEDLVVFNLKHDKLLPEAWHWGVWDWRYAVTNRALRACADARWHLRPQGGV